jgi:hypothetical protein
LPANRRSAFEQLDAPALRPLPAKRFEVFRWKSAKVNIDYHVEFDGHYYSVPHALVRTSMELRVTATLVEMLLIQPARGLPPLEPFAWQANHHAGTHACLTPGASGMDTAEAHRLGFAHWRQHGGYRDMAACTPPASGAGLPGVHGHAAPGAST